jgi:(4-alkanoyl-5-oxo-2,5-dihydrofuran-3-yl)methyl phosphate reductase
LAAASEIRAGATQHRPVRKGFHHVSGFMTNALYWASSIKAAGIVRTATGDGKIPFIHPVDIAEVAVKALTDPQYASQSLPITGPEALSYAEMTAKIGTVIGRALQFQAISEAEARAQQIAWNAPPSLVDGRQPIPFDQWARENLQAFQ